MSSELLGRSAARTLLASQFNKAPRNSTRPLHGSTGPQEGGQLAPTSRLDETKSGGRK